MKNLITSAMIAITVLTFAGSTSAQSFQKGEKAISAGIGIGSFLGGGIPLSAAGEYGVSKSISVGIEAGFTSYTDKDYTGLKVTHFLIGARGDYHFASLFKNKNSKWEPYAGLNLGYNSVSEHYPDAAYYGTAHGSSGYIGINAGSRYMFNKNIGAYAELGTGIALLRLGVTAKF